MAMTNLEIGHLQWRTAQRSANNGACVELAGTNGLIVIRDSKDPEGPVLSYSADAFRTFLEAAKRATSW